MKIIFIKTLISLFDNFRFLQVVHPIYISPTPDVKFKRWKYTSYNFTIATFWSPLLVKTNLDGHRDSEVFNIYLDQVDENWTSQINEFNYIILNAGHWFNRLYYKKNQVVGCWRCSLKNVTEFPVHYAYTMAFRAALKAINSLEKFKGTTFVRTFAPAHFEGGEWYTGGDCLRKRPFTSNEIVLEGLNLEFYKSQVEEFWVAEKEGKIKGKKFRLLDVTQAMLLRPDGHPSRYGHLQPEKVKNKDCVHWCLPGPIDSWNDFLFHMLKMEQ
ncbi:protein trichome birefringence-like 19 [Nicotiana attenuata]|uniref:Protein trichome birefringence-like 19 n=1 Tax=Nicotiana attenuata TaxID=49451 RepID=A0A314LC68_NICAT|nr:protein trichome birefringence-like 19 [Nicotiana attenuata]